MCEDYRAGAYADYDIDKADHDAGKKITIPMLALWGDAGIATRRGDAARHLEDMGDQGLGRAGRFRAFPDGGKSGRDGEVAGEFFVGLSSAVPSSRGVSATRCDLMIACGTGICFADAAQVHGNSIR